MSLSVLNGHKILLIRMGRGKGNVFYLVGWKQMINKEASNTSELFSIAAAIFVLIVIISVPGGSAGALLISGSYIHG